MVCPFYTTLDVMSEKYPTYKSPFWAINGHIETIVSSIFRKKLEVTYQKEIFVFSDSDITQLNWLKNNNSKLVIIIPGLGSNASKNYVQNTAHFFHKNQFDVLIPDHRDCGIPNDLYRSYHSSNYQDLVEIIKQNTSQYKELYLIGYSLGGSIAFNYIARNQHTFTKSAIISSPFNLEAGSNALEQTQNFIYQKRFVKNLKEKLFQKSIKYPNKISPQTINACKTIRDIDECYTAPAHGYKTAIEYYTKSSAAQFIPSIKTPILTINAINDSFIPVTKETKSLLDQNKFILNLHPKTGGHVAFPSLFLKGTQWHEKITLNYFNTK